MAVEAVSGFHPFEVTAVHVIYVGLGIFIVLVSVWCCLPTYAF